MGLRIDQIPEHYYRLMSPEAQAIYGKSTAPDPALDVHPPPKSDRAEKKEQAQFANWLLLQNSEGKDIPFCWHATHTSSKATPGTPDFWVGINGHSLWIEFKRDYSCKLSPEQETFRRRCEIQRIEMHVVYSAFEAIKLVQDRFDLFNLPLL
jgi:hypothetical protein